MQYLRLHPILDDVEDFEVLNFESFSFNGGEQHIRLKQSVGDTVTIEVLLNNSDNILKLLLATDALRRSGVKNINLICPYIPFSRQDRVMVEGEPLSIKVFTDLLNSQNYDNIYTLDNHSSVSTALINNCIEIDNTRLLYDSVIYKPGVLVCPDAGAQKRTLKIAKEFNINIVYGSKIRDITTGKITHSTIDSTDLKGNDCFIIDDICDGGRTFIEIAKILKQKNCGDIILYVSHGIFSNGFMELKKYITKIYTTTYFGQSNQRGLPRIIPLIKKDILK